MIEMVLIGNPVKSFCIFLSANKNKARTTPTKIAAIINVTGSICECLGTLCAVTGRTCKLEMRKKANKILKVKTDLRKLKLSIYQEDIGNLFA